MAEFKAIETQEALDDIIKERLKRQKEQLEAKYADYDDLKKQIDEMKKHLGEERKVRADLEKASQSYGDETKKKDESIEKLQSELSGYKTEAMKIRIALENGLSYDLAHRLVGNDEESIRSDAKSLASLIGRSDPVAPLKSQDTPDLSAVDADYLKISGLLTPEGD